MTAKKSDTMELWNSVNSTNPNDTKQVNQRGGFTAICAYSQIQRATELWGPYGGEWGLKDCQFGYVNNAAGEPMEITLDAVFYSPTGSFEISTDKSFRAGDDNRKKARTDALTKALSYLGFNADVFLGKFDDNKYVAEQKTKNGQSDAKPNFAANNGKPAGPLSDDWRTWIDAFKADIDKAHDIGEVNGIVARCEAGIKSLEKVNATEHAHLKTYVENRRGMLSRAA